MDPYEMTIKIQSATRIAVLMALIIVGIIVGVIVLSKKRGRKIEKNRSSIIIKKLACGHMKIVGTPLGAYETQTSGADYAGGVDVRVVFKNNTNKMIKYVSFVLNAYNAVGDMVMCGVKKSFDSEGLFTGPLLSGYTSKSSLYFRGMFYNASITNVKIKSALITYEDNTTEELTEFR